jgi:hypothetical protein
MRPVSGCGLRYYWSACRCMTGEPSWRSQTAQLQLTERTLKGLAIAGRDRAGSSVRTIREASAALIAVAIGIVLSPAPVIGAHII